MFVLYTLTDPLDGNIFYVGKTNNFERRFAQHLTCKTENFNLGKYLSVLIYEAKVKPIGQIILKTFDESEICKDQIDVAESIHIEIIHDDGHLLTNYTFLRKHIRKSQGIQGLIDHDRKVYEKCQQIRERSKRPTTFTRTSKNTVTTLPPFLTAETS